MLRFALQNERTSAPIISSLSANIGKLRLFAKKSHEPLNTFQRIGFQGWQQLCFQTGRLIR